MAGLSGTVAGAVGAFGKIPIIGDFVSFGFSAATTEPLHAWMSAGIAAARQSLGAAFEPAYMTAPAWRFLLPDGMAGPTAMVGVLLPSIDAVGRHFPLLMASPVGPQRVDLSAEPWFDALEEAGRLVLEHPMDLGEWRWRVTDLPPPPPAPASAWDRHDAGPGVPLPVLTGLLSKPAISCFWGAGSPHVRPGWLAGPGLPAGADFRRLLTDDRGPADGQVPPLGSVLGDYPAVPPGAPAPTPPDSHAGAPSG